MEDLPIPLEILIKMKAVDKYRQTLHTLDDWDEYLIAHSGLPGPRANLELLRAVYLEGNEVTASLANASERQPDAYKILRQALAYCWSVVVVALPNQGKKYMENWIQSGDKDVQWIMRENLKKARLEKMDPDWVNKAREKMKAFNNRL
jgi:hypothetical protein